MPLQENVKAAIAAGLFGPDKGEAATANYTAFMIKHTLPVAAVVVSPEVREALVKGAFNGDLEVCASFCKNHGENITKAFAILASAPAESRADINDFGADAKAIVRNIGLFFRKHNLEGVSDYEGIGHYIASKDAMIKYFAASFSELEATKPVQFNMSEWQEKLGGRFPEFLMTAYNHMHSPVNCHHFPRPETRALQVRSMYRKMVEEVQRTAPQSPLAATTVSRGPGVVAAGVGPAAAASYARA